MTMVKMNTPAFRNFNGLVNELFNDFNFPYGTKNQSRVFRPAVNIFEKEHQYELVFAVPGFEKNQFSIQIEKGILTISANQEEQKETNNNGLLRKEFELKSFKRSFTLDENIDSNAIAARYENGLLTVSLPKKNTTVTAAKQIEVQ